MDKEAKRIYNRKYYEAHKGQIKAAHRLSPASPTTTNTDAHRKASREYYKRKIANESPEEREARLAERRKRYKDAKSLCNVKLPEDAC